jgi:hypothetical protein
MCWLVEFAAFERIARATCMVEAIEPDRDFLGLVWAHSQEWLCHDRSARVAAWS